MIDRFLAYHPQRKYYEFDLRPPAQRSRFRKRMMQEAERMIAGDMYETDMHCRRRLGKKCKRLRASDEFVYAAMMLQDGVRPMEIVRYLRKHDPQNFGANTMTDDAVRMQIERMKNVCGMA